MSDVICRENRHIETGVANRQGLALGARLSRLDTQRFRSSFVFVGQFEERRSNWSLSCEVGRGEMHRKSVELA